MAEKKQRELDNCGFCKAVLMLLLIVLYHASLPWASGNWGAMRGFEKVGAIAELTFWLNSFHIYAFTLISGYIYAYLRLEKGRYADRGQFVRGKLRRLLVPYVCVCLLWVMPIETAVAADAASTARSIALGINPKQLWFLLMLFGVFMLFYPLTGFFAKHDIAGLAAAVALYVFGTAANHFIPNYFQIWNVCRYVLIFWIGFKLRQRDWMLLRRIDPLIYIAADIVLLLIVRALPETSLLLELISSGLYMLLCSLGAMMAFFSLQWLDDRVTWQSSRSVAVLIKYSMPVYLLHQQISYLLNALLGSTLSPYIIVPLNTAFTVLASLGLAALLLRYRVTRTMLGEKASLT